MNKLREEKRKTPIGRKGNVTEPIMRWYCKLQMIYWAYQLLYLWGIVNGIIPFEFMNGWWCTASSTVIKLGRMCIGWNSLFVALIRYIYIVHRQKSNQCTPLLKKSTYSIMYHNQNQYSAFLGLMMIVTHVVFYLKNPT
jgi:hypothetical protein